MLGWNDDEYMIDEDDPDVGDDADCVPGANVTVLAAVLVVC